ncbi:MFS transporter [Paenibacillus sp.]|uniref:MFS transporter n=1 Tax=Paenibacillus sp. TaxID=58172 RepID=UPI0028110346|nr:MFS transporter [Paenibacillus sp.]
MNLPSLRHFSKDMQVFMIASLVNSAGSSLMWPLISMYAFDELGRSMADAGFALVVFALGSICGQLAGGALYHRLGVKRLVVGSLSLVSAGLIALPFAGHSWPAFVALLGWIGWFNAMASPAIQSFIGFRFPERRAEMFNAVYVANNIGVAVGSAASGFLAEVSYALSFATNGVTSAGFAVFFLLYLKRTGAEAPARSAERKKKTGGYAPLANVRVYLFLAVAGLALNAGNSVWNSGVAPFILSEGMAKSAYGLLWTLNGVLIFVAQPLIGLLRRTIAQSYTSQMTASAVLYAAGFACFLIVPSYAGMVLGMILATFGEMLIAPAVPAFLSEAGGKEAPLYLGIVGGVGSVGRVVGPYAMGFLYDGGGLPPVAWVAVAASVLAAAFYHLHAILYRNRPEAARPASDLYSKEIPS